MSTIEKPRFCGSFRKRCESFRLCLVNSLFRPSKKPLSEQDGVFPAANWNSFSSRLESLEQQHGLKPSDPNLVLLMDEVANLQDRVHSLEAALQQQNSLFNKLISDFTKLEEKQWCSISSVASSHSPRSILEPDTESNRTNESTSESSDLTENSASSDGDSLDGESDS